MDFPLEETFDLKFTTRAFTTGVPTTLAGTPAVEIYEDNSLTQITAAETLTVDFDGVTGLNNLRIAATAANGFEAGKSYSAVISAGTVGGTSVVGEVIANFSIQRSAAAGDLANGTDGLGALKALIDALDTVADRIETDTQDIQSRIPAALVGGRIDANAGAISGDATAADNLEADYDGTGYNKSNSTIGTCTTNTDMRGTDGAATAAGLATVDANVDAILVDTGTTLPATLSTIAGYIDTEVAAILVDTGTTLPGLISALEAKVDTVDTVVDGIQTDLSNGTDGLGALKALLDSISSLVAASAIGDAVLDEVIEGSMTTRQALRVILSAVALKLSGAATTTINTRDLADAKNRITATVDADGNRSAVTIDGT